MRLFISFISPEEKLESSVSESLVPGNTEGGSTGTGLSLDALEAREDDSFSLSDLRSFVEPTNGTASSGCFSGEPTTNGSIISGFETGCGCGKFSSFSKSCKSRSS